MVRCGVFVFIFSELAKNGTRGGRFYAKWQLFSEIIATWTFVWIFGITIVIRTTYKCNFDICIFCSTFVMVSLQGI